MRLSIKAKQIVGVTLIVGVACRRAQRALRDPSVGRGAAGALHARPAAGQRILHRAREVARDSDAPYADLRTDPGLLASLQASLYSESVVVAAIVDSSGVVVASNDTSLIGRRCRRGRCSARWFACCGTSCA